MSPAGAVAATRPRFGRTAEPPARAPPGILGGVSSPPTSTRARRYPAVGPLAAVVLAGVAAGAALRIWEWRPGSPLSLEGDAPSLLAFVQAAVTAGPGGSDPRLGAPYALDTSWWATGDLVHMSALRLLALVTDIPTATALYFFLGFPLAALTGYWLSRQLGLARTAAVLVGVLFAVLPGHQTRFPHLLLAGYWTLPLGLWLVLRVAQGQSLWSRSPGAPRSAVAGQVATALVAIVVTGLSGVYLAAFVVALLACVLVVRLWRRSEPAVLASGLIALVGIVAVLGIAVVSEWRGRASVLVTGPSPTARSPLESEIYAGRAVDLVLPWEHHRLAGLADFVSTYRQFSPTPPTEELAIGLLALVGLVVAVIVLLRGALVPHLPAPRLLATLAVVALLAFAFFTKGGLGSLTALVGTSSIRTWARMSLVLGLCGLLAVGHWLTGSFARRGARVTRVLAILLLIVGVADQTNPAVAPAYAANADRMSGVRAFTDALESRLAPGCAVFQLPSMDYPEASARAGLGRFDELLPTLTSHRLRWSAGAVRGTAAGDWQDGLDDTDLPALLDDLAAVGFCAVTLHAQGYSPPAPLESGLAAALGPPIASAQGEGITAYELTARRTDLLNRLGEAGVAQRADAVLHPVLARMLAGPPALGADGRPTQTVGLGTTVVVANLAAQDRGRTVVRLEVTAVGAAVRTFTVTLPDGSSVVHELAPGESTPVELVLPSLAPGFVRLPVRISGLPIPDSASDGGVSARVTLAAVTSDGAPRAVAVARVVPAALVGG